MLQESSQGTILTLQSSGEYLKTFSELADEGELAIIEEVRSSGRKLLANIPADEPVTLLCAPDLSGPDKFPLRILLQKAQKEGYHLLNLAPWLGAISYSAKKKGKSDSWKEQALSSVTHGGMLLAKQVIIPTEDDLRSSTAARLAEYVGIPVLPASKELLDAIPRRAFA